MQILVDKWGAKQIFFLFVLLEKDVRVCFEFQMPNKAFRHLFLPKDHFAFAVTPLPASPARKWSFTWVKWVKANIIPSFPTCCSSSNPLIWCISKLSWWLSSLQEKKEHEEETKMLIAREFELRAERGATLDDHAWDLIIIPTCWRITAGTSLPI